MAMTTILGLFSLIVFFNLTLLLGDALAENVFDHYQVLKYLEAKEAKTDNLLLLTALT
jgi:hypothetical protein